MLSVTIISCTSNQFEQKLFVPISAEQSNIHFTNTIVETEDFNILEYMYMYNGSGVSVGDVNNDGLPDIYLTANQQPNQLYINKGNFQFEEVAVFAGVEGESGADSWSNGSVMVDINADGWLDLYLCQLHGFKHLEGRNQLFINNQDGTFTESAEQYGLAIKSYAQQAAFFDYDLDGDLDMYLLNQSIHTPESYKNGRQRALLTNGLSGDQLFRNDENKFVEVTSQAGIYKSPMGYGLDISIADFNKDNYPDIYVSNDFHENDYLYLNNQNGTFSEIGMEAFSYTSNFSMGNSVADVNNDGWLDIFTLDMKPSEEQILKTTPSVDDYNIFDFKLDYGYQAQYPRNMLQINQPQPRDSFLRFGEVAQYYNLDATDWSWGAIFADIDLDGFQDLFITNGILRRPNDLDFVNFSADSSKYDTQLALLDKMPKGATPNQCYQNGQTTWNNVSKKWGIDFSGYSNGAAFSDLDNDGDLDLIVNNLNSPVSIYENTILADSTNHYLNIHFEGPAENKLGIGTKVIVSTQGRTQYKELFLNQGWLSSKDPSLYFGVGSTQIIDSLQVIWPNNRQQIIKNVAVNQHLKIKYRDSKAPTSSPFFSTNECTLLSRIDLSQHIPYSHEENNFIDFEYEKLIPRMISREGPKIAVADVNGDGLDDFYIGGAKNQTGQLYLQTKSKAKRFLLKENKVFFVDRASEDVESIFFDADKDGDLDLYVVSGGGEPFQDFTLRDRLYINDGKGNFSKSVNHPQLNLNGSCVEKADFNQDGHTDLFVGARSIPGAYGEHFKSRILLGDGKGNLYDATERIFDKQVILGMVTDATWMPQKQQLIVVGEWMPVTILDFSILPAREEQIEETNGWWTSIYSSDIDEDGDQDLLLGNFGLNTDLKPTTSHPINLYLKDFDGNNKIDPILTYFQQDQEYPFWGLDKIAKQLPSIKRVYPDYSTFAKDNFQHIFSNKDLSGARKRQAHTFHSAYLENKNNTFHMHPLPTILQQSPIYSFLAIEHQNKKNLLVGGNFNGTPTEIGWLNASTGHIMQPKTGNNWEVQSFQSSGFSVKGQIRDMKIINTFDEKTIIVVCRNNAPMAFFAINHCPSKSMFKSLFN